LLGPERLATLVVVVRRHRAGDLRIFPLVPIPIPCGHAVVKITRVETIPVRVPIKPELAIKSGRGGTHDTSPFLIVKVHTDAGLVGLGEASCTPRWSGEDQVSAAHFINSYFAPALVGQDPTRIDELTRAFFPLVAGNYFTKAAVEMALWDL